MRIARLQDQLVSGMHDPKMLMRSKLLKVKLSDLSFDLAVQKCLAIEQTNKDVQVLQGNEGSGIPVHKKDTAKSGQEQLPPKSPPKTPGLQGGVTKQSLATAAQVHTAHKNAHSLKNTATTVA